MKRFLIKAVVFVLTFMLALFTISKIMNRDNNSMTKEMAAPTLPIVRMQTGELLYNELHGIVGDSNVIYQRDTMTVLGENRELSFQVELYDTNLNKLAIEVRSCDGSRLIEDTEITDYTIKNQSINIETSVKDLIEADTEYALIVVLTDENNREIRYFTRIIWNSKLYVAEKLNFVADFHAKTFDEEELKTLAKYMESNSQGNNTTLHKVNIHSSLAQVGWGELDIAPVGDATLNLKEIASQTATIELSRVVSTGNGKDKVYYFVTEVYRIRYTTNRVYLLDFERTMTQIPDVESDIYGNNKIMLGIVAEDTPLMESEDGNVVVFEAANRLCSYNITTNKLALLFSFYDKENTDARSIYDQHRIKILDINEAGNVQFAVYGYMNRGRHEGEIGIQLYAYDSEKNTIEESVYIPYEKSFDILDCEIENLLYWNREGILYLYLNHTIYAVNTIEKTTEKLAIMESDESIEISDNHKIAVWYKGNDLQLMNLNLQKQVTLHAGEGERLYPLGFMDEDLIYGVARQEDVAIDQMGRRLSPMYKVCICDSQGKLLKEYEQENIYMTGCEIVGNQITLQRVQKTESGDYKEISKEHIMNNVEVETGKNKLVVAAVDVYERIVQIEVRSTIDDKTIQILTPKEVVFEGVRETNLELEKFDTQYYVYDSYGVAGIYMNPATALKTAYDSSGVVVDESGKTIWIKGNRLIKNQIMAIKEQKVTDTKDSLAVCLDTILKFEGVTLNSETLLAEGKSAMNILQENLPDVRVVDLSGCNLDTILFFVNQDIPVLASLEDGEAVLVTGFNQYNVVIMEPSTGKLYKKGMNDSTKWFEENGNRFITYFRLEK
ncbi:MAG: hypothetical protein IJ379_05680 [Lachnospiraceae bacterium]|nr:hypothetical protein [Lachnospiraceae bacterium]